MLTLFLQVSLREVVQMVQVGEAVKALNIEFNDLNEFNEGEARQPSACFFTVILLTV